MFQRGRSTTNQLYLYIWVNYNDLTATSLGMMASRGDYPQMAQHFRSVKYYNLPRYIYPYALCMEYLPTFVPFLG